MPQPHRRADRQARRAGRYPPRRNRRNHGFTRGPTVAHRHPREADGCAARRDAGPRRVGGADVLLRRRRADRHRRRGGDGETVGSRPGCGGDRRGAPHGSVHRRSHHHPERERPGVDGRSHKLRRRYRRG